MWPNVIFLNVESEMSPFCRQRPLSI